MTAIAECVPNAATQLNLDARLYVMSMSRLHITSRDYCYLTIYHGNCLTGANSARYGLNMISIQHLVLTAFVLLSSLAATLLARKLLRPARR